MIKLFSALQTRFRPAVSQDQNPAILYRNGLSPNYNDEDFEMFSLLEAVEDAQDQFVMLELGAGLGRWSGRAANICTVRKIPYHLSLVEAEPFRAQTGIHQEMRLHSILHSEYQIFPYVVSPREGSVFFYIRKQKEGLDCATWYGQSVLCNGDQILRKLDTYYQGYPEFLTKYGFVAVELKSMTLSVLLDLISFPVVDFCNIGIQSMEYEVIAEALPALSRKVKRLHVATHHKQDEDALRVLLSHQGWKMIRDFPGDRSHRTVYGKIHFQDGMQTWCNPQLMMG